jgi:hypothetical protein
MKTEFLLKKVGWWGVIASAARYHTPPFPRIIEMRHRKEMKIETSENVCSSGTDPLSQVGYFD